MVENQIQHLIYGHAIINEVPADQADVLAISNNLKPEVVKALQKVIPLAPLPREGILASQAIAFMELKNIPSLPATYVLARAHYQHDHQSLGIYEYILLPKAALASLMGDLEPLIRLINAPLPSFSVTHAPLPTLILPSPPTWTFQKGLGLLEGVLKTSVKDNLYLLLKVLDAALTGGLVIQNFGASWRERLDFLRALMLLLPLPVRQSLSFTTYTDTLSGSMPHIVFSDKVAESSRPIFDWTSIEVGANETMQSLYVSYLLETAQNDLATLLQTVRSMDTLAAFFMVNTDLAEGLTAITVRHQEDSIIAQGGDLLTDELLAVFQSEMPPQGLLRVQYMQRLLEHALNERDKAAAEFVSQALDRDKDLAEALRPMFVHALDTQPDNLYVFIRTRLSSGIQDFWLSLLHEAASRSLDVAIQSGDAQTLTSWLILIGREPLRYELSDVLRSGLLAARQLAPQSSELAQELFALAVKRLPDTVAELFADEALLAALPQPLFAALMEFDASAIDSIAHDYREIFLLALSRAIAAEAPCLSPNALRALWEIHSQQNTNTIHPQYRPVTLMQQLATDGQSLLAGALEILVTLILKAEQDEFFFDLVPSLSASEQLEAVIAPALWQAGRTTDDILNLVNALVSNNYIEAQSAVNTYAYLLSHREWDDSLLPLMEQLGRSLNQYAETTTTSTILWRLVELSGELKSEQMMRAAMKRLLNEFPKLIAEQQIVENVLRLRKATQWSNAGRNNLVRWWREYVRVQSLVQLQRLDKAIEGQRPLDDLRSVIQTTIALRRVIANRSLTDFAAAIDTTYKTLQALSEAFDPNGKTPIVVDSPTIRNEINARLEEIPVDVRHVLATNLKELAQLVTTLAENRSKGFMRSDDSVERQLVTGEQQPQSAIDVMRWLSGYLDGIQRNEYGE